MQIILSVITGVIIAFLSFYMALNQYRKQKLWESKHKAYSDVLEAIFSIYYWADESYSSTIPCLPSSNKETLKELGKKSDNARLQLWKTVKIGALLLDAKTINALESLIILIEQERHRYIDEYTDGGINDEEFRTHCEKTRKIIDENLPNLIKVAKADIEVPLTNLLQTLEEKIK